jgi:hypothetical protein
MAGGTVLVMLEEEKIWRATAPGTPSSKILLLVCAK